jgi:3-oxoacyl-[acyl-carrier protein] reductase
MGEAIARRLSEEGAAVALTYPSPGDSAEPVAADIRQSGGKAIAIQADNSLEHEVRAAVLKTVDTFGRLDILVNNAGIGTVATIEELTVDQFDKIVAINIKAVFVAVKAALPYLREGSRIISTGSIGAISAVFPGMSIYSMSKAAVAGLTRGLARDLASRGITVNTVQPGNIDTDMNPADGQYAPIMNEKIPMGRYGKPIEVAHLVAFLASSQSGYITGSAFTIDGGFTS